MRRRLLAIVAVAAVLASGCASVRPPAPQAIEVVWDGDRLASTSDAPLAGEALVEIVNRSEDEVAARLVALPAGDGDVEAQLAELATNGGVQQLKELEADLLEPRRREPGRLAPRLVEDAARFHLHLAAGAYLILVDGEEDVLRDAGWLAFVVSPR